MINNKSGYILLLSLYLLWAGLMQAQESINSSGNDATGSGGSVAYSIGQVVYTTHTGISNSVAQGVQHAYEIFLEVFNTTVLDVSLSAFPNPAMDNLTLHVSDYIKNTLTYQLYDMQGKLINSERIIAQETIINTANLLSATYFLHIFNVEDKQVFSFKFIKTK
jgi:hypothetical protein